MYRKLIKMATACTPKAIKQPDLVYKGHAPAWVGGSGLPEKRCNKKAALAVAAAPCLTPRFTTLSAKGLPAQGYPTQPNPTPLNSRLGVNPQIDFNNHIFVLLCDLWRTNSISGKCKRAKKNR